MYISARRVRGLAVFASVVSFFVAVPADAQHQHEQMNASGWQFMQDGLVFAEFNHQGSVRGGNEFVVPNWWMGMASRETPRGRLTFTGMVSLDPTTVGKSGYREIFQVGEALNGRPLIDRQHPHDLFMQLSASWRFALSDTTGLTLAAAPVGEAALGPIAFMHRPSAAENPTAPLGHHTFDSSHLAFGVVTAAIDHRRWAVEASLFNGREPDENRWDFDLAPLDSVSGRLWFRPSGEWEIQASTGFLRAPEELEPGNVVRTTVSATWFRRRDPDFAAVTIGYGHNDKTEDNLSGVFVEGTRHVGLNSVFGRLEIQQVETSRLLDGSPLAVGGDPTTVLAVTLGGVRDVLRKRGFELGIGGDISVSRAPDVLQPTYGSAPISFHVFLRLRPPAPMGRMWNMRMSQPPTGHPMAASQPMP